MICFPFLLVLGSFTLTYTKYHFHQQQDQLDYSNYESDKVRQIYETALKVFPDVFALTQSESERMSDLLLRSIQSDFSCKKKLSKYMLRKIDEVSGVLNATQCEDLYISRYRRSDIKNSDGSITTTKRCVKIGESLPTNENFISLAASCSTTTDLTEKRYPRFINEVICDESNGSACIKKAGAVTQFTRTLKFRFDANGLGLFRLGEWPEYDQQIRTGCACNVMRDSPIRSFLV